MSKPLIIAAVLTASLGLSPARADEPAQQHPTKDVDIVYKPAPANAPKIFLPARTRFSAKLNILRTDGQDGHSFVLLDLGKNLVTLADSKTKTALVVPSAKPLGRLHMAGTAHWEKRAPRKIAGLSCTDWQVVTDEAAGMTQCFTDDGILLRSESGGVVTNEATKVTFAAQDEASFTVPKDFKVTQKMKLGL